MSAIPIEVEKPTIHENERKWSKELMTAGWTAIPSVILERQQALGLNALDVNILLHIARHWWRADELPFPSKTSIAECIGVNPRTVQRHIAELEEAGLIQRVSRFGDKSKGQLNNAYDLRPLIREAKPFAAEVVEERKARQEERRARRIRKLPKMQIAK